MPKLSLCSAIFIALLQSQAPLVHAQQVWGDWEYEVVPDYSEQPGSDVIREATIVRYTGSGGDVVIPSRVGSQPALPVTQVGKDPNPTYGYQELPIFRANDDWLAGNTTVTSVTIPASVRRIAANAFGYSGALAKAVIGSGTTSIGEDAFTMCNNLADVSFGVNITRIADRAFLDCIALTNVTLPDGLESIGSSAFQRCSSLGNIDLGASLKFIGQNAFWGAGLANLDVPHTVTSIGVYAFAFNHSLTNASLGDGLLNVPDGLFRGNSNLSRVVLPNQVLRIGDYALYGCNSLTMIGSRWTPAVPALPSSVVSLGDSVFAGCSSLLELVIPEGLTAIPPNAFSGCSSLRRVGVLGSDRRSVSEIFPKSLSSIGDYAFNGTAVSRITIPVTTYISPTAFQINAALSKSSLAKSSEKEPSPFASGVVVDVDSDIILSKEIFLAALATNQVFLSELANQVVNVAPDNYGFATKEDVQETFSTATTLAIAQVQASPNDYGLYNLAQNEARYNEGVTAGTSLVTANPASYNLYTPNSIMDLRMGGIMMQKHGSNAVVTFQPQTTADLAQPFTNHGTPITNTISMPGNKGFLRIQAK